MRSGQTSLQSLPKSYERRLSPLSYGRQQFYGPVMPGAELDQQQAIGEAMLRYPLGSESFLSRSESQYGYTVSRSFYPIIPTPPIPSSWPEQSTQHEDTTPPQEGGPRHGQARSSAQAAHENERERQGQSWTPPSRPDSPLSVYNTSPPSTQPQPLWGSEGEREMDKEVNEEAEGDKVNEKGEEERNEDEEDLDDNREGKGEVNDNGKEEGEEDGVWTYMIVLICMVGLQSVVSMVAIVLN
jgi:hypothetical protein